MKIYLKFIQKLKQNSENFVRKCSTNIKVKIKVVGKQNI